MVKPAGRTILQLYKPTGGSIKFNGTELNGLKGSSLRAVRRICK